MLPEEVLELGQRILEAKKLWHSGNSAGNANMIDNASVQAVAARDRLNSLGYGWVADNLGAEDTLADASSFFAQLPGLLGIGTGAPGTGAVAEPAGPAFTPTAGGTPNSATPVLFAAGFDSFDQTPVTTGAPVAGYLGNLLQTVDSGIRGGANVAGQAAGGLAGTAVTIIRAVWVPVLAILGVIVFGKVFKIRVGGGR